MADQPSIPASEAAPQRLTDRLFFAIFPDVDAAVHIAQLALQLRGEHGLHGMPLKQERFHVTLHHLGDYAGLQQGVVAMASQAAAAIALPPFDLAFDRAASFCSTPRNRPFVLRGGDGVAAVTAFQRALGMEMTKAELGQWAKPAYTPHVTLLYDDRCVAEHTVETIRWTAHEFVLMHSLIGQNRHVPLARWSLRG
jgi:RNA 2',3'-cyclic 3'-phosphodiesterase